MSRIGRKVTVTKSGIIAADEARKGLFADLSHPRIIEFLKELEITEERSEAMLFVKLQGLAELLQKRRRIYVVIVTAIFNESWRNRFHRLRRFGDLPKSALPVIYIQHGVGRASESYGNLYYVG